MYLPLNFLVLRDMIKYHNMILLIPLSATSYFCQYGMHDTTYDTSIGDSLTPYKNECIIRNMRER
jgi:hypothetical protein